MEGDFTSEYSAASSGIVPIFPFLFQSSLSHLVDPCRILSQRFGDGSYPQAFGLP